MQCDATESNQAGAEDQSHVPDSKAVSAGCKGKGAKPPQFKKVLDGRKHPVRGLWVATASGHYYAQLSFEDSLTGEKRTRRVPLLDKDKQPVLTLAQAVAELARLKTNRADGDVPVLRRTPRFGEYVATYLDFIKAGHDGAGAMKKASTIYKEGRTLQGWVSRIGGVHLDKIRPFHVNNYVAERKREGVTNSTVNLDVITLRNVLKQAKADGWLKALPTAGIERLKTAAPRRPLFSAADLDKLCSAAQGSNEDGSPVTKNGAQLADYMRLLAYCGAREQEALKLRWADVDFEREQLVVGASGDTKNSSARVVDFNPRLKEHLEDMFARRAPNSQWLFPSPQRGEKDVHAKTFRESLKLARARAGMEAGPDQETPNRKRHRRGVAFHDLRHHFISYAVMSGIDFMTVASWVGHRDGGILIGKVYGHLADTHKKAQAQRLNFGPAVVEAEEEAI